MRYVDNTGDTWEDGDEGTLRVVAARAPGDVGLVFTRSDAEEMYGPLQPLTELEPQDEPSPSLPTVGDVMDRAAVFQAAHSLVTGLKWDEDEPLTVFDVLSVAKWLEGAE